MPAGTKVSILQRGWRLHKEKGKQSSPPHFTDHRPKTRSWERSVSLARAAAGLSGCPLYVLPRKFSKQTRIVQEHDVLL